MYTCAHVSAYMDVQIHVSRDRGRFLLCPLQNQSKPVPQNSRTTAGPQGLDWKRQPDKAGWEAHRKVSPELETHPDQASLLRSMGSWRSGCRRALGVP